MFDRYKLELHFYRNLPFIKDYIIGSEKLNSYIYITYLPNGEGLWIRHHQGSDDIYQNIASNQSFGVFMIEIEKEDEVYMDNITKWKTKFMSLIPAKGLINVDSLLNTSKEMSSEIRRYNADEEYMEIREYWFFMDEQLLPALGRYVQDNLNTFRRDLNYCTELMDSLVYILITKLDSAQRYGRVEEDSLPIGGIQDAIMHNTLQDNETYLKQLLKDKELVIKKTAGVTVDVAYNNVKEAVKQYSSISPDRKLEVFAKDPFRG